MRKVRAVLLPTGDLDCRFQSVNDARTRSELLANLPLPLDLFVPEKADRLRSALVTAHQLPPFLATELVYPLEDGIFVCSPRTTLLQLARTRGFIELALAVFEMCGTYGRSPQNKNGFFERPPLTSCDFLAQLVERQPEGARGKNLLGQVLSVSLDGAASPMESVAALHLGLPGTKGGYGLAGLRLNYPLEMPAHLRRAVGRSSVRCDLYYPAGRVAVEYDSDRYHQAENRIASDSKRRAALELMGVRVVSLTRAQLMDLDAMDVVAAVVCRLLKRNLPRVHDFRARQLQMRSQLLDFSREL